MWDTLNYQPGTDCGGWGLFRERAREGKSAALRRQVNVKSSATAADYLSHSSAFTVRMSYWRGSIALTFLLWLCAVTPFFVGHRKEQFCNHIHFHSTNVGHVFFLHDHSVYDQSASAIRRVGQGDYPGEGIIPKIPGREGQILAVPKRGLSRKRGFC